MSEEFNNRKRSALEELKRLQKEDRRAGVHYEEPELKHFDAQSIFEINKTDTDTDKQKGRAFHLGKHSKKRSANIHIVSQDLENKEIKIQDINFGDVNEDTDEKPVLKRTETKRETGKESESVVTEEPVEEITAPTIEDDPVVKSEIEEPVVSVAPLKAEESKEEIENENEMAVASKDEEATAFSADTAKEDEVLTDLSESENIEIDDDTAVQSDDAVIELGADDLEAIDEQEDQNDDDIRVEFYEEEAEDEDIGSDEPEVPKMHEEKRPIEEVQESEEFDDDVDEIEIDEENLYEEKKRFLFSQYVKEQKYLEKKSQQGYHYVKREGNNFFFTKGDPRDFYYILNYYKEEPDTLTKYEWRKDGWKLITKNPSKNSKDAGWFVLRNEEHRGEYRKTIENEEEKYDFFRKYVNSCRSTLFLVFICMACCFVTGVLQISYQGYLIGIAACAVLFLIALVAFISYLRMLRGATKMSRLLRARLRLRARERSMADDKDESDEELDTEWNLIDK